MLKLYLFALVLVAATAACGDDTTATSSGNGGAGGDDPVVTVAGSGGQAPGCTGKPEENISCSCADGTQGTKRCVENQLGEATFGPCEVNGNAC